MKQLIIVASLLSFASSANILGVFPFPSESHHVLGSILMGNLAKRGHNVTYISPFKMKTTVPNVTTLVIDELVTYKEEQMQKYMRGGTTLLDNIGKVKAILNFQYVLLDSPKMEWFMKSDSKYDLMIHFVGSDASLGLAHHFDVPIILFTPLGISQIGSKFGNPNPTAYVPSVFLPYSEDMNFCERLINTITELVFKAMIQVAKYFISEAIQEYFPGAPPLSELENRIQLGFVNSHISMETARPYVPAMVQIGGFHLQDPEPLPADLKKILDESTNGVIYFSFGTNVKVSELPQEKLSIMLTSLGKLPLKVLLKSDKEVPDRPDNVEIRSWFPQRAVLSHSNVKLFISHGGYGGSTETLFFGVPMICMPFFADQHQNCATAEHDGYAINLPLDQLTPKQFNDALNKLLNDKTFITNAKLKSELYRDQEMNPMDRAAYWVNHVIKHKGAKHLRVKALDLTWYQYYLLDVIAFISFVILLISAIVLYSLRCCANIICRRQHKLKTN